VIPESVASTFILTWLETPGLHKVMADFMESAQNFGGGGIIQPIEEESVRRIVAGQAVSDLASAVKELVDNSLDAGSKSINSMFFCIAWLGLLWSVSL
jgi:hypothetical protein